MSADETQHWLEQAARFEAELTACEKQRAALVKALEEIRDLAGSGGPPNEIDACNEIERVAKAALTTVRSDCGGAT